MEEVHFESVMLSKKDSKTQSKLNDLFYSLKTLRTILEASKNKLTKDDAKLFLLTKINDLDRMPISHDREQLIEIINIFLEEWISSGQAVLRLLFEGDCGIRRDCSYIWLPRIGNITLANPSALLKKWDSEWVCYKPKFVLVDSPDGFIIEIPFVVKTAVKRSNKAGSWKPNSPRVTTDYSKLSGWSY